MQIRTKQILTGSAQVYDLHCYPAHSASDPHYPRDAGMRQERLLCYDRKAMQGTGNAAPHGDLPEAVMRK